MAEFLNRYHDPEFDGNNAGDDGDMTICYRHAWCWQRQTGQVRNHDGVALALALRCGVTDINDFRLPRP